MTLRTSKACYRDSYFYQSQQGNNSQSPPVICWCINCLPFLSPEIAGCRSLELGFEWRLRLFYVVMICAVALLSSPAWPFYGTLPRACPGDSCGDRIVMELNVTAVFRAQPFEA
jgi:hypothetical protein